jgi:tetratricopeptide (TPR) repeat protein
MPWLALAAAHPLESRSPVAIFVVFFVIFFGIVLLLGPLNARRERLLRALKAVTEAHRRGDYEGQLKLADGFRVGESEPRPYLFYRGEALYQLGRLDQAERVLRRCLGIKTTFRHRALTLSQLGLVLMEQERWEDAATYFRQSIAEWPQRGGGHRHLAELLLRQDVQPEAAVEPARSALANDRSETLFKNHGKSGKQVHNYIVSESLAVLAWALARNHGDRAEIEGALNKAFALCGEETKSVLAEIYYYAGQAYAALGDGAASSQRFKSAAEIDPIGNYGRLAQSMSAARTS